MAREAAAIETCSAVPFLAVVGPSIQCAQPLTLHERAVVVVATSVFTQLEDRTGKFKADCKIIS